MTESGKEILEILRNNKSFSLAGNKEFYEILKYENGKILDIYGDTMIDKETGRTTILAAKALNKIKKYFQQHSKIWENKTISTDEEVLDYWKRWKHEG